MGEKKNTVHAVAECGCSAAGFDSGNERSALEAPVVVKKSEIKEMEDIRVRGEDARRTGRRRRRRRRGHEIPEVT